MSEQRAFIPNLELESVDVKWPWSHFDGRAADYNDEGDHNFTIVLPEEMALELSGLGWPVKRNPGREEGDPDEFTMKVKISYQFGGPKFYLIKKFGDSARKMRGEQRDLVDIKRSTLENLDLIITPSFWEHGKNRGVSAYASEIYATITESRFGNKYADFEEI